MIERRSQRSVISRGERAFVTAAIVVIVGLSNRKVRKTRQPEHA